MVWPSHHCDAQNFYDLEKINVEWSGPLTTVTPKIITTSEKKFWPSHHRDAQLMLRKTSS